MDIMKKFKDSRGPSWLAALVLAGFGSAAMAQVISITPTRTIAFGTVNVGSTSASTTLTVRNSGTATLNFSGGFGSITSGNAISFPVSRTCGNSLRANSSCTVTFSFKPNLGSPAPGTDIAAVFTISSNALSGANTISLSGKGVTVGVLGINPTTLAFGNVATGSSSGPKTVILTNSGTGNLSVTNIALTTNTGSSYSIVGNNCLVTLLPTATCTFGVLFSPGSTAGSKPGTITITSNTGGVAGTTRTMSLTGSGVTPLPVLTLSTTRTVTITCSRPKGGPATATVGVSNTGTGTLNFASPAVTFSAATSARFTKSDTCSTGPLAPGNTCSVAVTFTPTNTTTQTGTLNVIPTNAGTKSVGLSGSCTFFTSP